MRYPYGFILFKKSRFVYAFCCKYRVRTFYMVASGYLALFSHSQADKDVLAEVGDAVLYANEVSFSVPKGLTPKDSLLAAKKYVHDWVVDQMMLQEAESKVDSSDQIDEMVDEYRRSLLHLRLPKADA